MPLVNIPNLQRPQLLEGSVVFTCENTESAFVKPLFSLNCTSGLMKLYWLIILNNLEKNLF